MESKPDQPRNQRCGRDVDRRFRWNAMLQSIQSRGTAENRLRRAGAFEQPRDQFLSLGDEQLCSPGPGLFKVSVGLEARILGRFDEESGHAIFLLNSAQI